MKPVIGITPAINESGDLSLAHPYCEAILRNGGFPMILPSYGDPAEALDHCDGILLSGGADIAPECFGVTEYDKDIIAFTNSRRDEYELAITRLAYERDIPMLGICRGVQTINVALGGTLVLDLPGHHQETERHLHHHTVKIAPGSTLCQIVGAESSPYLPVNSTHHQSVDRPAPVLCITAIADDGINEAVESPERRFCVGVQWHPERLLPDDPAAKPLAALIAAARQAMAK